MTHEEILAKVSVNYPAKTTDHVKWCEQWVWEAEGDTIIQWSARVAHTNTDLSGIVIDEEIQSKRRSLELADGSTFPYVSYSIKFLPSQIDEAVNIIESGQVAEFLEPEDGIPRFL